MRFCLELRGAPDTEGARVARHFAAAIMNSEQHHLWKIFFVGDGALHAERREPTKPYEPHMFWYNCAEQSGAELLVCAAAAQMRASENFPDSAFTPCGLAEMMAPPASDVRLVSFNP